MIFHGVKDLAFSNSSYFYFMSVSAHDPSKLEIYGMEIKTKRPFFFVGDIDGECEQLEIRGNFISAKSKK